MKFKPSQHSYGEGRNFDYPTPREGGMAKNYLRQVEEDAQKLRLALKDDDNLPGWVNSYIFTSADRLGIATRYMHNRMTEQGYGSPLAALSILARPAHGKAQTAANRGVNDIDMIIIHTSEGDPNSQYTAADWFADPRSKASAHYTVHGTGTILQSVAEKDIAWHAGNSAVNKRSLGIEIQGQAAKANWTGIQLNQVARLTAALARKYNIPIDRDHIKGHVEVSGPGGHWDPGPHFPWGQFMGMVKKAYSDPLAQVKQAAFSWGLPLALAVGGLVAVYFIEKAVEKKQGKR
jgi:hypothetical protein